ncbi:MAG TPA: hypothetical protein VMV92_31395 [Streptosporangiaceae bacterium]|nr:hypothetical protein [Streptosporangiaceae bacterium]
MPSSHGEWLAHRSRSAQLWLPANHTLTGQPGHTHRAQAADLVEHSTVEYDTLPAPA